VDFFWLLPGTVQQTAIHLIGQVKVYRKKQYLRDNLLECTYFVYSVKQAKHSPGLLDREATAGQEWQR
jgi:hypothetical protein